MAEVLDELRPGPLRAIEHDAVGVLGRLVRHHADMQSAQDHRDARRTITIGQGVGLVDLRRERGDADEIERLQLRVGFQFADLTIRDLDVVGREGGDGQEAEAGERGDDLPAIDELRQRHAEGRKLRRADANAAHGDEADFHGACSCSRLAPASRR